MRWRTIPVDSLITTTRWQPRVRRLPVMAEHMQICAHCDVLGVHLDVLWRALCNKDLNAEDGVLLQPTR